jgi:putative heme-binding domain-containing protein
MCRSLEIAVHKIAITLWALSLAAQQDARNPRATPEDIAAGAKTFRSHCAPCHGLNAEGGRGPNLAGGRLYHGSTDEDLIRNISEGIPGTEMPGAFYMEDRVRQIIAYIRSLRATAPPTGNPTRGAALFESTGCVRCHLAGGRGGRLGPDLTQIGRLRSQQHLRQSILEPGALVSPRYRVVSFKNPSGKQMQGFIMNEDTYTVQVIDLDEQLHSYDKSALRDYKVEEVSKMPPYKDSLTAEQVNDLVAYLSALRPE